MISILYVDDEPGLLEIAKMFLEQTKEFSVATDTSAQSALNSGKITPCDAIIADYQMPGMDGIAFLKAVRSRYRDLPFILFTGRGREEVVIQAINNGADFYLQKGGDPTAQFAELAHKVRQAVARRHAERSLVESEKRLADIINFLPDATFAIDRNGTVIAWNRAIEEMTGVPAGSMLGKGEYEYAIPFYGTRRKILIDLIFEPDEVIAKNYSRIIHEKDILIAETPFPRPKGRVVTLMGKASPLCNRQGEIVGAIESIRDISALKEAEARTRRILEQEPLPLAFVEKTGMITFRNDRFIQIFGYTAEDVPDLESWWKQAYPDPGYRTQVIQEWKEAVRRSADEHTDIRPAEYRVTCKNGEERSIEISGITLNDGFLATFVDLTERRMTDAALRESEEKYRTLIEQSRDGFYIVQDGRIVYYNRGAFNAITGYKKEEILGKPFIDLIAPEDRGKVMERIRKRHDDTTISGPFEFSMLQNDGHTRVLVQSHASTGIYQGRPALMGSIQNITEDRRREDALRESEERYRSLFENNHAVILLIDPDTGSIVDANPAACAFYQWSHDELVAKRIDEINTLSPEEIQAEMLSARSEKRNHFFFRHRRADGTVKDVEVYSGPLRVKGRHLLYSILFDITERKQVEEELKSSESSLRLITENMGDQISRIDKNGKILYVSPSIGRVMGYTPEEFTGTVATDYIHPDDRELVMKEIRAAIARHLPLIRIEFRYRQKNGKYLWFESETRILYDETGEYDGAIFASREITGRKRVEKALRTSEERLKLAMDATNDGLFDWDLEEGTVYFSPRYVKMLGYEVKDLPASFKTWENLLHPDDRDRALSVVSEYREGKRESHEMEFRLRTKDGGWRWILSKAKITGRSAEGKPERMVGTHTDITDRKMMEYSIQEVNRKLNLLNSITRHDLANQLTILQGYIQIAMMNKTDPVTAGFLSRIEATSQTIARQLEFTKTYQELGVETPSWFSVEEVIAKAGTGLVKYSETCKGTEIFADPMLEKVFFNLFDNAARHGERVTQIIIRCEQAHTGLLIVVEDNGIGIPAGEKEKIFERGFGKHTGLGLFLAKEILAITGIAIRETGVPGKGARFELLVPKSACRSVQKE